MPFKHHFFVGCVCVLAMAWLHSVAMFTFASHPIGGPVIGVEVGGSGCPHNKMLHVAPGQVLAAEKKQLSRGPQHPLHQAGTGVPTKLPGALPSPLLGFQGQGNNPGGQGSGCRSASVRLRALLPQVSRHLEEGKGGESRVRTQAWHRLGWPSVPLSPSVSTSSGKGPHSVAVVAEGDASSLPAGLALTAPSSAPKLASQKKCIKTCAQTHFGRAHLDPLLEKCALELGYFLLSLSREEASS